MPTQVYGKSIDALRIFYEILFTRKMSFFFFFIYIYTEKEKKIILFLNSDSSSS